MMLIIISLAVFVAMLLFPIGISLFFFKKSEGQVLEIQQSKIRDPRYFAKSFTNLFEEKWKTYEGSGKIFLSHEEEILEADRVVDYPTVCSSIVFAENLEFKPQAGVRFEKEIYSRQNACLYGVDQIRSACSKKNLVLGSGTQVLRWVDAQGTLTVYNKCDLGISGSSATKIIIGGNCYFRRLYAPTILLGITPDEESLLNEDRSNVSLDFSEFDVMRDIKYVDNDMVNEFGVLEGSIITTQDILVLTSLIVKGHIRSNRGIRIYDNAVIYGNLFAEGDIYLGQNVRVFGSVFTQENLFTESGVTIGQYGKIKSVIARGKIIFDRNCRVYGYVSSEMGGECYPDATISEGDFHFMKKAAGGRAF